MPTTSYNKQDRNITALFSPYCRDPDTRALPENLIADVIDRYGQPPSPNGRQNELSSLQEGFASELTKRFQLGLFASLNGARLMGKVVNPNLAFARNKRRTASTFETIGQPCGGVVNMHKHPVRLLTPCDHGLGGRTLSGAACDYIAETV